VCCMSILVRLRSFFIPATIGLILMSAAGWYSLFWLPSQHRYLDDRNFRILKTLSDQIRLSINGFDKMMDNAADSGITSETLQPYLNNVASQLEKPDESESKTAVGDDYGDPPKMAVAADEGTHFLYLAFKRDARARYAIRTDLDRLIDKLSPPAIRCPFDALVIAQSDGTVIYQKSLSGIVMARINTLDDASGETKPGKSDTQITLDSLSQSSRLEQVKIAGARYRLYGQPLQLSFAPADPSGKAARNTPTGAIPKPWILCGLVRADRFRSESQAISYRYILWLSAAILLAITSYPFLRLHVSSPAERLRASDVISIAVSTCFAAATLTFVLLDLKFWQNQFNHSVDDQMQKLAAAIDSNFENEKNKAFGQLQNFYAENSHKTNALRAALHEAQAHTGERLQLTQSGAGCNPPWACKVELRSDSDPAVARLLENYPYLHYVNWSDYQGKQRVKWTTRKSVTPFLNLNDPSVPYYPAIKTAFQNQGNSGAVPTEGIGSQYSPNTGDNITIFWRLLDADGNATSGKVDSKAARKLFCASLVTKPISVFDPVLPGGFQFAVIGPDGTVVFHSDHTRNLRENFFAETDQNQDVHSRVAMRAAGSLVTNYMGRPNRLYLRPMNANQDELWTVVVFRELHPEETMNLETLSLASIMFFLYAGTLAFLFGLAHWMRRGRVSGSWLWPDSHKAGTYRLLAVINVLVALLFFFISDLPSSFAVLLSCIFIPVSTLVFNLVMLSRQDDGVGYLERRSEAASSRWQLGYVGTCAALLTIVAVLPCLSFFKVAFDFEQKLFVESSQLKLAQDIEQRAERLRVRYQGIEMGRYTRKLLATPEEKTTPYFSYHETLDTTINSAREYDTTLQRDDSAHCSLTDAVSRQHCVEFLLISFSPLYNQVAADTRYLAEVGSSGMWTWSSSFSPGKVVLTKLEPGQRVLRISSPVTPIAIPWASGQWWVSAVVFMAALSWFVCSTLRGMFLLDLIEPLEINHRSIECDPKVHHCLFSRRSKIEKLVLVHLAQEQLVNPNCRQIIRKLISEGLVEKRRGLLAITDPSFANFLKRAVTPEIIQRWERQEAGVRFTSLRTSLLVIGVGVAAFLIYTQGNVFSTWVTYMTGLAASVPVFLRLFEIFRHGGSTGG